MRFGRTGSPTRQDKCSRCGGRDWLKGPRPLRDDQAMCGTPRCEGVFPADAVPAMTGEWTCPGCGGHEWLTVPNTDVGGNVQCVSFDLIRGCGWVGTRPVEIPAVLTATEGVTGIPPATAEPVQQCAVSRCVRTDMDPEPVPLGGALLMMCTGHAQVMRA